MISFLLPKHQPDLGQKDERVLRELEAEAEGKRGGNEKDERMIFLKKV